MKQVVSLSLLIAIYHVASRLVGALPPDHQVVSSPPVLAHSVDRNRRRWQLPPPCVSQWFRRTRHHLTQIIERYDDGNPVIRGWMSAARQNTEETTKALVASAGLWRHDCEKTALGKVRGRDLNTDPSSGRSLGSGNKLKKSQLGAAYQAYQALRHEYEGLTSPKRASRAGSSLKQHPWRVVHDRNDIEIALRVHPTDPTCPYVRMKARIPVPVHAVWNFLRLENWSQSMPVMDPYYEGHTTHGDYQCQGIRMVLCRKHTTRLLPGGLFGKRDFTFLSISDAPNRSDGTLVGATLCVDLPHQLPRQPGYVRAYQDSVSFYTPSMDATSGKPVTLLTIVVRLDLNDAADGVTVSEDEIDDSGTSSAPHGHIPMWLYVQTVGTTAALTMSRLREAVVLDHANSNLYRTR